MKKSGFVAALGLAVGAFPGMPSYAAPGAESGVYLGAMAGKASYHLSAPSRTFGGPTIDSDQSDTAYSIFAGYRFAPWLAVEGGYADFGQAKRTVDWDPAAPGFLGGFCTINAISRCNGNVRQTAQAKAYLLSLVGALPVTEQFEVFAKLGVARAEGKLRSEQFMAEETSETRSRPLFGIGAHYSLTPKVVLRLEWNRLNGVGPSADKWDMDSYTAGVVYRF